MHHSTLTHGLFVMLMLMQACSPADAPAPADTAHDGPTTDVSTSPNESPPTDTPTTTDTGLEWPEGLHGTRIDPPVPPLGVFVSMDTDDTYKGPADLYNGTPTLLTFVTTSDPWSDEAMDAMVPDKATLEVARIDWVVMTENLPVYNLRWATDRGYDGVDIWSDIEGEVTDHYVDHGAFPLHPGSLLLDADGDAILVYDTVVEDEAHLHDVAEDAVLLWGIPSR